MLFFSRPRPTDVVMDVAGLNGTGDCDAFVCGLCSVGCWYEQNLVVTAPLPMPYRESFCSLFEQCFVASKLDQLWVIAELLVVRLFCPENKCVTPLRFVLLLNINCSVVDIIIT